MTVERMIELLNIEHECMLRKSHDDCDSQCEACELVQDDDELHEMYTCVISNLEAQKSCGKAISRNAIRNIKPGSRHTNAYLLGFSDALLEVLALPDAPYHNSEPMKPIQNCSRSMTTWWYECRMCGASLNPSDKYCNGCGRLVKWG